MKKIAFFINFQKVKTMTLFIFLAMSGVAGYSIVFGAELTKCSKIQTEEQYDPNSYFDKIWQVINDKFWDPNFNSVNWKDTQKHYKPKALAAKDHESFAVIINQMLGQLKTSHTHYFTKWDPDYYTLQAVFTSMALADLYSLETPVWNQYLSSFCSSERDPHRSGIGVVTKKIDGRYYVTAVLASSPAEEAGIVLGDWLVEVNGKPFHPIRSFDGMAGQELEITIQRKPSASTRYKLKVTSLDMKERELFENDSQSRLKSIEYKGHQFVYIRLWWLSGLTMQRIFEPGLNMARASEGMIIDLRDGFGGGPYVEYIDPFLRGERNPIMVESIYRDRTEKSTVGFNKPVIVLINGGSRSGKETLAYCFKKWDKAVLLGQRTAGYVTGGNRKRISRNSFLYYSACMKVIDGKRLEGVGVEPDVKVPFDIRFAAGKDIQLERAKDEMVKLIETSR